MTRKRARTQTLSDFTAPDGSRPHGRRLLIVYDGLPPWRRGGAETRLGAIARGLAERGWQVSWMGLAPSSAPVRQPWHDVTLIRVGTEPAAQRSGQRRGLRPVLTFLWRLQRAKPEDMDAVLLGQSPWLHFFIMRRCMPDAVPIIVDCWEVWGASWHDHYGRIMGRAGRWIESAVLRRADLVACISPQTKAAALLAGAAEDRVFDSPNGADPAPIEAEGSERWPREIAYFGRLVPHKNVHLLLEAFVLVAARFGDARLLIIGGGGERTRLEAKADALGIVDRVMFLGEIEDHARALQRLCEASLFVQPSTSEGGGSVAVHEAHACGLPVVAFRHPLGIDPTLIREGETGFWISDVGTRPLADRLIQLLSAPGQLEPLRPQCRRAAAELAWPTIARTYEAQLLAAIARRRASHGPLPQSDGG